MARIGILGGTFNPPHVAHLVCAQEARHQVELDHVLLVPVNIAPHKAAHEDPGPGHRTQMCELAAADEAWLEVSTVEIDRPGQSYTVDTLRELHERSPGDELVFIIGADAAAGLPGWRRPEEVLRLATLAVAGRGTVQEDDVRAVLARVGEGGHAPQFFAMPRLEISSTDIRRRVGAGRPVRHLVPLAVEQYIGAHGLYGSPAGAETQ